MRPRAAIWAAAAWVASLAVTACGAGASHEQNASVNFPLTIKKELALRAPSQDTALFSSPDTPLAIAWSPHGTRIAAASNYGGTLTVWDSSGRLISQAKRMGNGPVLDGSIAFADGSSHLLFPPPFGSSDKVALSMWDAGSGAPSGVVRKPDPGPNGFLSPVSHFAVSPDQASLVAMMNRGQAAGMVERVVTYDAKTWSPLRSVDIDTINTSFGIFGAGQLIVVGSTDGSVTVVDLTGKSPPRRIQAFDDDPNLGEVWIGGAAGSPDGQLVFAGAKVVMHGSAPEFLKSASAIPTARVLRASDGLQVATFRYPASPGGANVGQAAWDPLGRYVAFVDADNHLYLWRPLASQTSYAKIVLPSRPEALAISPDGRRIAVGTETGIEVYSVE